MPRPSLDSGERATVLVVVDDAAHRHHWRAAMPQARIVVRNTYCVLDDSHSCVILADTPDTDDIWFDLAIARVLAPGTPVIFAERVPVTWPDTGQEGS